MASGPEPTFGSASSLPATPREAAPPETVPRDTVPTGPPPHSTLPPAEPPAAVPAAAVESTPAPRLAPGVPATAEDTEHNTLHSAHSASHPGSGSSTHWDERRIVRLEHELDQLSARHRLLDKRLDDLGLRLRWLVTSCVLAALMAAVWWSTRG